MLTNVQKETLQTLINLYQSSDGKSVKGEEIAEVLNRNPGTIRNQMLSLRRMNLVKSVPGPLGGYKPTLETYHSLDIPISDDGYKIPVYKNDKIIKNITVAKIEFTSVPQPRECEAAIKILGSIKDLNIGDKIRIGPTPVNNMGIIGTIVGRDDMENVLLLDTTTIRSIPKQTVGDIASREVITISPDCSIKEAAKILAKKEIDGAPVIKDGTIIGIFTLENLVYAIANNKDNSIVGDIMSTDIVIINENLKIANAIDLMIKKSVSQLIITDSNQALSGIVTRSDLIDNITNLRQFPILPIK